MEIENIDAQILKLQNKNKLNEEIREKVQAYIEDLESHLAEEE